MKDIGDDRGYGYFAGIHGLPLPVGSDNAHGTPYFLPWHRAYLYFFERALRDQVPDATLGWWDWRTPAGRRSVIPPALSQRRGNPLYDAPIDPLARQQGRARGGDPGPRTTRQPSDPASLALPTPEDTMVDRIWRVWETHHPGVGPPGTILDDALPVPDDGAPNAERHRTRL